MLTTVLAYTFYSSLASFALQADSINSGNSTLLMIFVGLVALAMLTIAAVVVALALFAMKAEKRLMVHIEEIKAKALPLIDKSTGLVQELTPQIKQITVKVHEITAHVEDIASLAKAKAHEFSPTISAANETVQQANATVRDVNVKTQAQVERVNGMISSALDATALFGRQLQHGITQPGREVSGVVAGVKAAFTTFIGRSGAGTSYSSAARKTYRGAATSQPQGEAYRTAVEAYRASSATRVPQEEDLLPGQRRN